MKKIFALAVGVSVLATLAHARGPYHPDPYSVITKGKIITSGFEIDEATSGHGLVISYQDQILYCFITSSMINSNYRCKISEQKTK